MYYWCTLSFRFFCSDFLLIVYLCAKLTQKDDDYEEYDYRYDKLHRLIDAKYDDQHGNAEAFMTNYGYDKNGNIDCIMRQAITMDYEVAPLDEMTLYYTGNQLRAITSFACPDDFEDYTPYPVSGSQNAYSYDQNGNTTKDLDRNILSIQYNLLNLPRRITYTDGSMATYTYNSLGEKLRVAYATSSLTASLPAAHVAEPEAPDSAETRSLRSGMPNTTVDYCGNLVYNGTGLSRILLGGEGYCQLASGSPLYFFFIKDHLGSTRAVVRQDGSARQCNQYYPYGKSWSGGYSQPYLYNGKEIDVMHGLEWYDYGARMYEPGICRFMTMDPLCEKYYNISPYAYCGNNPVRYVDPDGNKIVDSKKRNAVYINNDKILFTKYATPSIKRVVNSLQLTQEGKKMLTQAVQSDILVEINISKKAKRHKVSETHASYTYGETIQGNFNPNDNCGRYKTKDGKYGIKMADVTIYEGTIIEDAKTSNAKHSGLTLDQAIGAVAGHELVHATDQEEINKDITYEMEYRKDRVDKEVKANEIETIIINQSKQLNK